MSGDVKTLQLEAMSAELAGARKRIRELLAELRAVKAQRDALNDAHASIVQQLEAMEGKHERAIHSI